jgi:hypothetical protein
MIRSAKLSRTRAATIILVSLGSALPILLALLLLQPTAQASTSFDAVPGLSGRVRDSLGKVLEGVELLVAAPRAAAAPVAIVRTDLVGRFAVSQLAPGSYRIAAIKPGYRTSIAQIDTQLERFVELVLHPMPEAGEEGIGPLPGDGSWALRLPRRTIFRETEADVPTELMASSEKRSLSGDPVQMQFDHRFDYQSADDAGAATALHGSSTHLNLASQLNGRGNLQLAGSHRHLEGSKRAVDAASRDSRAGSFNLDFSYDTSPEDQLEIEAFFSHRGLDWNASEFGPATQVEQLQQSWGYKSEWSRQLDPRSVVAVRVDYQDRSVSIPNGPMLDSLPAQLSFNNRTVGAETSYRSVSGAGHQLDVGFRAQLVETPVDLLFESPADSFTPTHEVSGWSLRMDAQDAWAVTGPLTIVYGVAYQHALYPRNSALIVPRVGSALAFRHVALRLMIAYNYVAEWENPGLGSTARLPFRPDRRIGYEAEIEVPLASGLHLAASASYEPVQFADTEFITPLDELSDPRFYRTDGNASARRSSLALVQEQGETTRTFIEISEGQAEGTLTPPLITDTPLILMAERQLRYRTGRFGVRILPSGTDLELSYQRVREHQVDHKGPVPGSSLQALEVRLAQDLLRLKSFGSWRLLMAVRLASAERSQGQSPRQEQIAYVDPSGHGVSAGLSVAF